MDVARLPAALQGAIAHAHDAEAPGLRSRSPQVRILYRAPISLLGYSGLTTGPSDSIRFRGGPDRGKALDPRGTRWSTAAWCSRRGPWAAKALATETDKLMTHFELPAEHWKHLRTTNPIESTFATVKLRQRVTKGAGSRGAGLAMAYRLLLLAERSWRRLDGDELLPLVRAAVRFEDGVRVERDDGQVKVLATKRLSVNEEKRGKVAA